MRGFSRETIITLAANIESREWRCKYLAANNEPPEHPRASTTDDVECFFSVLRDSVGKDFTLKEVNSIASYTLTHALSCRFNLAGEELYMSLLKGLIQNCLFITTRHLEVVFMREKCLILIRKETKVPSQSVYLSMNCSDLTIELHFLSVNLLQSEPPFTIYQSSYHHHLARFIN